MLVLYHGGGSGEVQIEGQVFASKAWSELRIATVRLLRGRKEERSAEQLERVAFILFHGTNCFGDEFTVLRADLAVDDYVALGTDTAEPGRRRAFATMAMAVSEVTGTGVRFVVATISRDLEQVADPALEGTAESVTLALSDARSLLASSGAASAVDRVHTALHGYLRRVCRDRSIAAADDASITALFKAFRSSGLLESGPDEMRRVLSSLATVVDALNTLRNNRSLAHANDTLLDEPEAMLAINATRTLFNYIEGKLKCARTIS